MSSSEMAMFSIRSLFARKNRLGGPSGQADQGAIAQSTPGPDIEVAVIGDVHGRLDLLAKLIAKLERGHPNAHRVFVGDYVDRGPDSRGVLERLAAFGDSVTCLMGNHEAMLLKFLNSPISEGERWFRNGGTETLLSFGISMPDKPDESDLRRAQSALADGLSPEMLDWLRERPLWWQSGNLLVTHAGPDPALPISDQDSKAFLWGHRRFLRDPRGDDIWVAHGHWIQERAMVKNARIAVDTGAYFSGRLTAGVVTPDGRVKFVTV